MSRTPRAVTVVLFVAAAVAVACLPASAQTCGVPPAGVVHQWSGDDNANDSVGGNNGTPSGGVTYGPGVCGHAFIFDGTGSVNVPNAPSLALGPAFTMSAWVRIDQTAGDFVPFVSHDDGGGSQRKWMLWYTPSAKRLGFELNALPGDPPIDMFPISVQWQPLIGRWYHLAVTYDGNVWGLYVNGAQVAASVKSMSIPEGQSPLQIGAAEAARLTGGVDEVSIFSHALQPAEILALYNGEAGNIPPPSMVPTITSLTGQICQVPCTATIQAVVTAPDLVVVNEGAVHLQLFDRSDSQVLGDWTTPVTSGVATFQNISPASTDTPQTLLLTAGYSPTSSAFLASSMQSALSITPPIEASIPIVAHGPLAVDEQTNRVYAGHGYYDGSPGRSVQVFDGTTNMSLDPIVLQFGTRSLFIPQSVAIDTARRKLYVFSNQADEPDSPDTLWVWDLDLRVVTDVITLGLNGGAGPVFVRVNPSTGLVYVGNVLELITVNPLAPEPDRVSHFAFPRFQLLRDYPFVPGVNSRTNLIYGRGQVFDGSNGGALLPASYDFRPAQGARQQGESVGNAVGVNRQTNRLYVPALDLAADPCGPPCFAEGSQPELLEVVDADPASPNYNTVLARLPLTPRLGDQLFGWFAAGLEVNTVTNRTYVSFATGYTDESGIFDPGNPIHSNPDAFPISVFDGATGHLSTWWYQELCGIFESGLWNYRQTGVTITINPVNGRIYINSCDGTILVYRDAVTSQQSTSTGSNVAVTVPQVTLTFPSVSAPGNTTIQSLSASELNVSLPGQFSLTGAVAYDISTTATVTAPIQLCFNASSITDETTFDGLAVLHAENGVWVDRTVSRDFTTGTICASSPSLSPFAVARRKPYTVKALYDTTRAFKTGSTAPIKIQIFDPTGASVSTSALAVTALHLIQRSTSAAALLNDSGSANPDSGFRFDASMVGYIFNLSLKGVPSGTYDLQLRVGADGRTYSTTVQVR